MDSLMEDLAESECRALLETHHFGRVAFVEKSGGPPVIIPLNYLVHAEAVVVRTDPRSKLGSALRDAPVSQYVRITPELLTGRRISVADLPSNWWG